MKKALKLAAGAAAAAAAGTAAASGKFFRDVICRKPEPKSPKASPYQEKLEEGKTWLKEMEQKSELHMLRSFDGLMLSGRLILAEGEASGAVLAVHGYGGSSEDCACAARMFHQAGFHVLLVDNRAHGSSEGKYVGFGCLDREDCYRWIQYLNRRLKGQCGILLYGISMGAAAVLMTAELNLPPSVKGIVADSPYTTPLEVFEAAAARKKCGRLPAKAVLACGDLLCRLKAGYGFLDCSAQEAAANTKIPVFLIHGERDQTAPAEMSRRIYQDCVSPKKLWIAGDAGHLEAFYKYPEEYRKRVLAFCEACEKGEPMNTEKG